MKKFPLKTENSKGKKVQDLKTISLKCISVFLSVWFAATSFLLLAIENENLKEKKNYGLFFFFFSPSSNFPEMMIFF